MIRKYYKDEEKLKVPLYKLFPNFITIIGLCLGISAVRYALDQKMQMAAGLIIIAAFMDGIDGRLARLLNSTSSFGAHLDSLADIVSFGVAPAVVVYLWSLHEIPYKGVGWAAVLFYITCSALRLARFNVQSENKKSPSAQNYFTGVPMPSAAILSMLPMMFTFELINFHFSPWIILCNLLIISFLMVSTIPTFSFKKVDIEREYVMLLFVGMALLISSIILEPWLILPFVGAAYLISIPVSVYSYYRK